MSKKKNDSKSIVVYRSKTALTIVTDSFGNAVNGAVLTKRKADVWGQIQLTETDVYMEMSFGIKRK